MPEVLETVLAVAFVVAAVVSALVYFGRDRDEPVAVLESKKNTQRASR